MSMKVDSRALKLALMLLATAASSCEVLHEIGSECSNGECSPSGSENSPDCIIKQQQWQVTGRPSAPSTCSERQIDRGADGLVPCEVFWYAEDPSSPPPELLACSGALEPAGKNFGGSVQCRVNQIAVQDASEPLTPGVVGFYYSDEPVAPDSQCHRGVVYTPGLSLPEGARAEVRCTTAALRDNDGSVNSVDGELCMVPDEKLSFSGSVGRACQPAPVPSGGFDFSAAYLDTAAQGCGGSPCLVWHLEGDPSAECSDEAQCASQSDVDERVYCTCRCDLPPGEQGPSCACPNGFGCVPVFEVGAFAGSYCVKDGTFTSP